MIMRFSQTTGCFYPEDQDYASLPDDLVTVTQADYDQAMARQPGETLQLVDGVVVVIPVPAPTPADRLAANAVSLIDAVQVLLDSTARARGYDNILSAVSYADENAVTVFQNEGKSLRVWRSKVWAKCYALFDQVKAGTLPTPTAEQLISMLPTVEW